MPKVTVDGQSYTGVGTINVGGKSLAISQEYSGNKAISANGTGINVEGYSTVSVSVPASGITPSGTKTITSNATYDVTNYASVIVNVPSSGSDATIYTGLVGWGNRTPSAVNGKLRLQSPTAGEKGWLFESGASVYLDADFGEFGTATAADVASGKTFTSAAGLKVSGTGTVGATSKFARGTITAAGGESQLTINTGLSDVYGFIVCPNSGSAPSGKGVWAWIAPAGILGVHDVLYNSSSSGSSVAGAAASGYMSADGGTITVKPPIISLTTYPILATTYGWVAWEA